MRTSVLVAAVSLACTNPPGGTPSPSLDGVEISARSALTGPIGDTITTWVTIVNETGNVRTIEFSACPTTKRVTLTSAEPASAQSKPAGSYILNVPMGAPPGADASCLPFSLTTRLAPRSSTASRFLAIPVSVALGDSVAPGLYRVRVFPGIAGASPDGIPAGDVDLRTPPRTSNTIHP
jgi:hypothetical protein